MPTEAIRIFTNRQVGKAASIVPGTPVYLGKCGPESLFWMDASLSGSGSVKIKQRVCDTPSGDYYEPGQAPDVCAAHTSGRDRYDAMLIGTEWFKPKVLENNVATATVDLTLVISKK